MILKKELTGKIKANNDLLYHVMLGVVLLLAVFAVILQPNLSLFSGLWKIQVGHAALITDPICTGGVGAALLYATVMLLNKKLSPIPAYDKTVLQLGSAALVLLPYLLLTGGFAIPALSGVQWLLLCLVGILHTGIAYTMYFGAMKDLPAKTIAIFSYLDPVIAVILSAVLLHEKMTLWGILGTVLILGSALYSELPERR